MTPTHTLSATGAAMYRLSLVTRMWLCHLTLAALLGIAWVWGWLDSMVATDTLYLVRVNCCLFVVGVVIAQRRAHWLSRELDEDDDSKCLQYRLDLNRGMHPAVAYDTLRAALGWRIGSVSFIASMIMLFGLAGTIVGFIVATSAVTPEAASDAGQVGPMAATMIGGVGLALYKTLVGIALGGGYLMLMHRLLAGAATHALSRAVHGGR